MCSLVLHTKSVGVFHRILIFIVIFIATIFRLNIKPTSNPVFYLFKPELLDLSVEDTSKDAKTEFPE